MDARRILARYGFRASIVFAVLFIVLVLFGGLSPQTWRRLTRRQSHADDGKGETSDSLGGDKRGGYGSKDYPAPPVNEDFESAPMRDIPEDLVLSCTDPGTPFNGRRTVSREPACAGCLYTMGTRFTFSCAPSFSLEGEPQTTCMDGEWDTPLPTCLPLVSAIRWEVLEPRSTFACTLPDDAPRDVVQEARGLHVTEFKIYHALGPEERERQPIPVVVESAVSVPATEQGAWRAVDDDSETEWIVLPPSQLWAPRVEYPFFASMQVDLVAPAFIDSLLFVTGWDCWLGDPQAWRLLGYIPPADSGKDGGPKTDVEAGGWLVLNQEKGYAAPAMRFSPSRWFDTVDRSCMEQCAQCVNNSAHCLSCARGYELPPLCSAIFCADPGTPANAQREGTTQYGGALSFECAPKFRLRGASRIECRIDGTWSAEPPTCEPMGQGLKGGYAPLSDGRSVMQALDDMHRRNWPVKTYPRIDFMVRTGAVSIGQLRQFFRSIDLFWPKHIGQLIIILDEDEEWMRAYVPDTWRVYYEPIPHDLPGYYFQQLSNCWADNYTDAAVVMFGDTDSVLTTPVTPELVFRTLRTDTGIVHEVIMLSNDCCPWERTGFDWFFGPGNWYGNFMYKMPIAVPLRTIKRMRAHLLARHPEARTFDELMRIYWLNEDRPGLFSQFVAFGMFANMDTETVPIHIVQEDKSDDVVLRVGQHIPYWNGMTSFFPERIDSENENDANTYSTVVARFLEMGVCFALPPGEIPGCPKRTMALVSYMLESFDENVWTSAPPSAQAAAVDMHFGQLHAAYTATRRDGGGAGAGADNDKAGQGDAFF